MKDKIIKTLLLVAQNRGEVEEIRPSGSEYYFKFRGRFFSLSSGQVGARFYIYPRFVGDISDLVGALEAGIEDGDLTYVFIGTDDLNRANYPGLIEELYSWFEEKYLGLDKLFADLGIH